MQQARKYVSSDNYVPEGEIPQNAATNFTSPDCGSYQGTASGPPLMAGQGLLAINGNTDLSSCIVGKDGANVSSIYLVNMPRFSFYQYQVNVYGQGPSGAGSWYFYLYFTDQTGDTYKLKLFRSEPAWHYVQFNSDAPGIVQVTWDGA
ncbi:hypothetical protein [Sinorhizobium saheli]|jgi:hypothetical protein|uniref:Uncharacterized protein n=1 Tax=Sinorhizobium saheli TaxID=36856 RepID=A0A178YKB6_SINSA|nr:hypothetical protein [Sinorhizobium saheli]MQW89540.1 hypothetical protein [Sinorhizobium saheli]OAP47393.1 hypothetical protein ATB98_22390 [Sinorhizobium saheli]